ncbi:hypothetical protein UFOVP706_40 [uncultured Caudovirales phage]|uniref:Uncharacterized protein n=1 Tax=uncultured Caudovirales phage TaxID=2100421 RepID=A0A6J5NGM5_9CAUD|nr:hypothetical protein UFOVP706_40 [uncultured Caudovirales phage]
METPINVPVFIAVMWITHFALRAFLRKAELEELKRIATGQQLYVSEAFATVMAQRRAREAIVSAYVGVSIGLGACALLVWLIG